MISSSSSRALKLVIKACVRPPSMPRPLLLRQTSFLRSSFHSYASPLRHAGEKEKSPPQQPVALPGLKTTPPSVASVPSNASLPSGGGRMIIGFTCKVCSTRSHKSMSKDAYERGVVIIQCDGCQSRHLIADHLGWFDTASKERAGTIEDILAAKGEQVKRVSLKDALDGNVESGMIELLPKD